MDFLTKRQGCGDEPDWPALAHEVAGRAERHVEQSWPQTVDFVVVCDGRTLHGAFGDVELALMATKREQANRRLRGATEALHQG